MKKLYFVMVTLIVASLVLTACGGGAGGGGLTVGMVTDLGGIDDKSFNATAYAGIEKAVDELGIEGKYLESTQQADYEKNIQQFLDEEVDLIVTVGFLLGDATKAAAEANPEAKFAIVDFAYDPALPNVLGLVFATDQASFLAGYAAAASTKTGKVATWGGVNIPPVTDFMVGFESGVNYYNEQNGTAVEVLGWSNEANDGSFIGNFESLDDGRSVTESLVQEGADIVMPVAGPAGLGGAAYCAESGACMIIGVDTDWTVSASEYSDVILTSVLKNMNVAVFEAIKSVQDGTFAGGLYVGTLGNNGVGLADVKGASDALKAELDAIQQGIADGSIEVR
jgi:basic membrane protein A